MVLVRVKATGLRIGVALACEVLSRASKTLVSSKRGGFGQRCLPSTLEGKTEYTPREAG